MNQFSSCICIYVNKIAETIYQILSKSYKYLNAKSNYKLVSNDLLHILKTVLKSI